MNGLGAGNKRYALYTMALHEHLDFVFVQETHSTEDRARQWEREVPGANFIWAHGSSSARGVALMYIPNINIKAEKVKSDNDERLFHIRCTWADHKAELIGGY